MSERDRCQVEQPREPDRQARAPELQRRSLSRRGENLDLRVVQFSPAWSLLARDDISRDRQDALGRQTRRLVGSSRVGENYLAEAAAITHDQERHLAQAPLAMQPAHHRRPLACVSRQLLDQYALHCRNLPIITCRPVGADGRRPRGATALRLDDRSLMEPGDEGRPAGLSGRAAVVPRSSGGSFTGPEDHLHSCRWLSRLRRPRYSSPSSLLCATVARSDAPHPTPPQARRPPLGGRRNASADATEPNGPLARPADANGPLARPADANGRLPKPATYSPPLG